MRGARPSITPGHIGRGPYRGVIRVDGRIVWTCDHDHRNRERTTRFGGVGARRCAAIVLEAATIAPSSLARREAWLRIGPSAVESAGAIAILRAEQAQQDYARSVAATVRAALAKAGAR
jgi:hypothetical protein